ncbi:MAG: cupin domain-containing protein [Pseudomonadota bacterium]
MKKKTASTDFITLRADEGWFELAPKIEKKVLHIDHEAGTESYLLRVQPGAEVPPHTHAGDELCVVLEGEVTYEGGLRLQAGDYHMAKRGSTHQHARSETGALVYLQGALEDRQTAFRD